MGKIDVGGQAVIEGVMMRGSEGVATSVRKEDGEIITRFEDLEPFSKKFPEFNKPFLRGIFVLIDSMKIGINALNYSASLFQDEDDKSGFEKWLDQKFKGKANDIIITLTMIISIILSIGVFVGIPTLIAGMFNRWDFPSVGLNLIEAVLRIAILIFYMWIIAKMDDIYRVFQYHGAEHKTIFCYEAKEELTVENVRKHSRFHPRCGTNFLFLVMLVSVVVFAFTGWGNILQRLLLRIILIPVISGISYEIIKWLGKSDEKLARMIAYPGLKLQALTTREPDDKQIEVAITALMEAEGLNDETKTIEELLDIAVKELDEIDTARLDAQLLLAKAINQNKLYVLINNKEKVEIEQEEEFLKLIKKRKNNMPVKYLLGECDFMGLDYYVEEGVLIPRSDTEVLVDEVLKEIPDDAQINVCDLCSGTGAIGISLAHYKPNIIVNLIDYYEIPEKVSKANIKRNEMEERVSFIKSNLLEEPIKLELKYSIIVSNPPYIRSKEINGLMSDVKDYEPITALDGGEDGLDFYRKIVDDSKNVLIHGGILAFEIGYDQGEQVKALMERNGFSDIRIQKDLAGLDRVVLGKFSA